MSAQLAQKVHTGLLGKFFAGTLPPSPTPDDHARHLVRACPWIIDRRQPIPWGGRAVFRATAAHRQPTDASRTWPPHRTFHEAAGR